MERIFRKTTEEERERHRLMREAAEAEMPEMIARDKLHRQLWGLADEAQALLEYTERGETPPAERVQALRDAAKQALESRRQKAAV